MTVYTPECTGSLYGMLWRKVFWEEGHTLISIEMWSSHFRVFGYFLPFQASSPHLFLLPILPPPPSLIPPPPPSFTYPPPIYLSPSPIPHSLLPAPHPLSIYLPHHPSITYSPSLPLLIHSSPLPYPLFTITYPPLPLPPQLTCSIKNRLWSSSIPLSLKRLAISLKGFRWSF